MNESTQNKFDKAIEVLLEIIGANASTSQEYLNLSQALLNVVQASVTLESTY